jgi:hypothetical protein
MVCYVLEYVVERDGPISYVGEAHNKNLLHICVFEINRYVKTLSV